MTDITSLIPVIDLPFLAREINDAHRQVTFHGKSMLLEAKRAGDFLRRAKDEVRHGEFAEWVARHCECSYRQAMKYMRVSKIASQGKFDPDCGIDAFLDAHATPRVEPTPAPREFTRADAERALKLHALAERGGTEAEQAVASNKLASFAKEFGLTPEAVIGKSKAFMPDHEKTDQQRRTEKAEEDAAAFRKERDDLRQTVQRLIKRREELFADFRGKPKEELIDLLVAARLQLEGFGA